MNSRTLTKRLLCLVLGIVIFLSGPTGIYGQTRDGETEDKVIETIEEIEIVREVIEERDRYSTTY